MKVDSDLIYPNDKRRRPGKVVTYFLNPAELEELNQKYPPKKRKITSSENAAKIVSEMDKNMREKRAKSKR
jgi:hypothetical protein